MFKYFFIIFFVFSNFIYSNPWGKDSDLVNCKKNINIKECQTPILGAFGEIMIGFHQEVISPADGPRSHFIPSSSQYTLDAMRKHGFFEGYIMGCDRLMRENSEPWVYSTTVNGAGEIMKWDPVK